jgi:RNA polymerase sigma-70 factor (ECF subfamily)
LHLPQPDLVEVTDAQQGDQRAWARLVERWSPVVLRWCAYLGVPQGEVEEVAHEVFIRLLKVFRRLDGPHHFRSFLYGITRRVVAEHRRRAWLVRWLPGPAPECAEWRPDPEHSAAIAEALDLTERILAGMPLWLREVLVLSDVDSRSLAEVSELLGIPVNTVKSRLHRARVGFRAKARREGLSIPQPTERRHDRA